MNNSKQAGEVNPLLITSVLLGIITIVLAAVSVWAYTNYQDQKNNTDEKIAAAVEAAEDEQAKELDKQFAEREKQPTRKYSGPADLGSVRFDYPKTWSVHVADKSEQLMVYLHPLVVPPVEDQRPFATRVEVISENYNDILSDYEGQVEDGELKSSTFEVNGFNGIRLDGKFGDERQGSAVIFKVRDKTLIISSDSTSFAKDFNEIILPSLEFNP